MADGAVVYGLDHQGHGRSDGERVLITDFEKVVEDLRLLHKRAAKEHSGLPVVLIGHSMGGAIATRYAQRYGKKLSCVVLSAPAIGEWAAVDAMLASEEAASAPIDPVVLSRDPAVSKAYAEDPLVWHGPFKRPTLEALRDFLAAINSGPPLDDLPVLWLHGSEDRLVPYDGTSTGWSHVADAGCEASAYPGARHEVFNETNKYEVLSDVVAFIGRHVATGAGRWQAQEPLSLPWNGPNGDPCCVRPCRWAWPQVPTRSASERSRWLPGWTSGRRVPSAR